MADADQCAIHTAEVSGRSEREYVKMSDILRMHMVPAMMGHAAKCVAANWMLAP